MPNPYCYLQATKKCEELTKQMVEEVGDLVFSIKALEHTLLLTNLEVVKAEHWNACESDDSSPQSSHLLSRELDKISFSLEGLKKTLTTNIRESRGHLKTVTANLDATCNTDGQLPDTLADYQDALRSSINRLNELDGVLFDVEICLLGVK